MTTPQAMVSEARHIIDGEVNCKTPEYRALDSLCNIVKLLVECVEEIHIKMDQPNWRERR